MTEPLNQDPYSPIACTRYSEYEVAILHRQKLHLRWREDNVHYDQVVLPLDLKTINHEEFLICRGSQGEIQSIRLDRIQRMEPA
ncbi:MAG: transcriptional antiterminator, Rof [Gammaproteobacteria bacterium]|nr:transcriptional antiterminator, Rof [Gammaproteobacteria bacterium]MBI5782611.1 transcriptional antiterminator, Rof [Gammaproteobacteria bacterium]